jgi:hypothetical protein|eukprot:COSAG06_NODE_6922_length_2715_cov_2.539755_1_plen_148_part_00
MSGFDEDGKRTIDFEELSEWCHVAGREGWLAKLPKAMDVHDLLLEMHMDDTEEEEEVEEEGEMAEQAEEAESQALVDEVEDEDEDEDTLLSHQQQEPQVAELHELQEGDTAEVYSQSMGGWQYAVVTSTTATADGTAGEIRCGHGLF